MTLSSLGTFNREALRNTAV